MTDIQVLSYPRTEGWNYMQECLLRQKGVSSFLLSFHGELHTVGLALLLVKFPGQRVHLQLLPQADLLQAVVEVGLWAAADGGRQSEDTHDLPLVFSGVHQQAEADQDNQQVDIGGLIPGFVH